MSYSLAKKLILASNSPRRRQLLEQLDLPFEVLVRPTDETFSADLPVEEVPVYLAEEKAAQFLPDLDDDRLVLCADTVVIIHDQILNKPATFEEACAMLRQLSGQTHRVITGVCLLSASEKVSVSDTAYVTFGELDEADIQHYVHTYRPYDKAGAYGVQEWAGMVGIERIEGSFYTVMGLPVHKVFRLLRPYLSLTPAPTL